MLRTYSIIILCVLGCSSDSGLEDVFKEYSPDGDVIIKRNRQRNEIGEEILISEEIFIQDSLLHGERRSYFLNNGQLRFVENYRFGELEGDQYYYHFNGQLKEEISFQNDKANGINRTYYEDGKLESVNRWIGGELIGEQEYYNPNESIRKYVFNDPEGNPVYQRTYNKNDKNYSEGGRVSTFVVFENLDGKLFSHEPIIIDVLVPTPPNSEVNIRLTILDSYRLKELMGSAVVAENGKASFKVLLEEPGMYYLRIEALLFESNYNNVKLEDNEFYFEVLEDS